MRKTIIALFLPVLTLAAACGGTQGSTSKTQVVPSKPTDTQTTPASPSPTGTFPTTPIKACSYLDPGFIGFQLGDTSPETKNSLSGTSTGTCTVSGPKGRFTLTVAKGDESKKLYDSTRPTNFNVPADGFHTIALTSKTGVGVVATWRDGRVFSAQFDQSNVTLSSLLSRLLVDLHNRLDG